MISSTQLPNKCTRAFSLSNKLWVQLQISRNSPRAKMLVDVMLFLLMIRGIPLPPISVIELKHTSTISFVDTIISRLSTNKHLEQWEANPPTPPALQRSVSRCASHLSPSCLRRSRLCGSRTASVQDPSKDISSQLLAPQQPINAIRIYSENLYLSRACQRRPLLLKTMQSCRRPTAIPLIR